MLYLWFLAGVVWFRSKEICISDSALGLLPYVKQTRNDSIISVKLNIVALLVVDELYAALMEIKQLNPAFNFTIFGDFFPIFWRVLLPPLFGKYICVNKISKYILEFVVSNSWFIYCWFEQDSTKVASHAVAMAQFVAKVVEF